MISALRIALAPLTSFACFYMCSSSCLPCVFLQCIILEILAGPPAPPGTPAFAVWANGAAQAAIAGGLRTPTSRANQTHQSHVLRPPGSPPPSGVTNSPRLSGHSSSSSASSGNDGSNNRTSDNGSSSSSSMGALNLDAEALEMELDGAGQGGRDGWSNLGAWALSESTWQKSSRGCRRAVGSGISSALGTSSVESYFPPTAYSAAGAAAAVAATGSSTACDNIDMPTSPPPPPPIDPLLCPPLRVKSVVGAPTLGAFVATMGQPTDGAVSACAGVLVSTGISRAAPLTFFTFPRLFFFTLLSHHSRIR